MAEQRYVYLQFANQEKRDWDYYLSFSAVHPKWHSNMIPSEYGTVFDGLTEDITGGTRIVEVKGRDRGVLKYPTIIIEDHKYDRMKQMWEECRIGSIYFNIFGEGEKFMLFEMPQIFESGVKIEKKKMNIKFFEDGEKKYKQEYRYFLPVEYAYVFDSDFKRTQNSTLDRTDKKCAAYVYDFDSAGSEITKREMRDLCNTQK